MLSFCGTEPKMNFPNSKFEMFFKNSLGDEIAGIWFVDGA